MKREVFAVQLGIICILLACAMPAEATAPTPIVPDAAAMPNTPCSIVINASHPGGGPLTYVIKSNPSHGTLTGTAPYLIYMPDHDYWGADSFTFTVANEAGETSWTATVVIQVAVVADNDDPSTVIAGPWAKSSWSWGYYWDPSYLYDSAASKGPGTYVIFYPNISKEGIYDMHIWHPSYGSGASESVPVDITHGSVGGETVTETVSINMREFGGMWKYVGQYVFNGVPGQAKVKMRTEGTSGYVLPDAFKFLYIKPLPSSAPGTPSGLAARPFWKNVRLSWSNTSSDEDGFMIEQSTDNVIFNEIVDVPAGHPRYVTEPLNPGTSYYFRVRAHNVIGFSEYSNTVNVQMPEPSSEIIPQERRIDWSQSGIPGGIPHRTVICSTVDAAAYGNGASDATAGIQSALNSCPANQVVLLSPGIFRINGSIRVPSNITLRGAGPQQTTLEAHGSGSALVYLGAGTSRRSSVSITGGLEAGSKSITVNNSIGIAVGSYLIISQLNDPDIVTILGNEGSCTWCDVWGGTRSMGQIVEVTSVNGTSIGIEPSLYTDYSIALSPLATPFTASAKYAGVEDVKVYMNYTGYTANFQMDGSAYCWIKNVEGDFTDGDHARAFWSYRGEIRDSYFHDAFYHGPGQTDTDLFIAHKTSGFLIENNIIRRLHVSIMLNWGAAGNVIAYNYMDGGFSERAYNALTGGLSMHGSHPMFNLWEGNVGPRLTPDGTWGSSSHNTAFRNWFTGAGWVCDPLTGRGPEQTDSCHWAIQQVRTIDLGHVSRHFNFVGNTIGSNEMLLLTPYNSGGTPMPSEVMAVFPQQRSYDAVTYGYSFGYGGSGDGGSWSGGSRESYTTAIIHGDYNYPSHSVIWDPSISTHVLPPSLYLDEKPSWFGSASWPAIGPDVTGYSSKIPAQLRWEQMRGQSHHRSDTNLDDCVDMEELLSFIRRWKLSNIDVSLREIMEAIGMWKRGCA